MPPSPSPSRPGPIRVARRAWPWAVLAVALVPATWHAVAFPTDVDREFPTVDRPTFSPYPPAAYRLAEPGDTLDRIGMYLASAAVAVAGLGMALGRTGDPGRTLRVSALGLAIAGFWYASNPWPTFDGWHGLGWRVALDPSAPIALRVGIGLSGLAVAAMIAVPIGRVGRSWPLLIARGKRDGTLALLGVAAVLVGLRLGGWPAVGPGGYWTRWAFAGGMWLSLSAMIRGLPRPPAARRGRIAGAAAASGMTAALVAVGLLVFWYHRPVERLRAIDPGKVFISAMPHGGGLDLAHRRHGFKTIINLFQEELPGLRSPHLDAEIAFAKARGIHYIRSPIEASEAEDFLTETLRLATEPDSWPVLVHCHGCMDRAPAWWGIYQFLVQERPLIASMRAIEQHRGSRPKGSVTLLYNRVLADRAPGRYRDDPTAAVLRRSARGTADPFSLLLESERRLAGGLPRGEGAGSSVE